MLFSFQTQSPEDKERSVINEFTSAVVEATHAEC